MTTTPWPPPPDLESIRDLVRAADPEGHIADGAPADEYEPEEDEIFAAIAHLSTKEIIPANLVPVIEQVWRKSFAHTDEELVRSQPALRELAQQISRFFGPEAQPLTRVQSPA